MIIYRGGTPFAIVAQILGYLVRIGSWTEPAEAHVPEEDAEAFEAILADEDVTFGKIGRTS
jgi:hypothetical protein